MAEPAPANINAFIVGDVADVADFKDWMTRLDIAAGVRVRDIFYFDTVKEFIAFQQSESVFALHGSAGPALDELVVMHLQRHALPVVGKNDLNLAHFSHRQAYSDRVLTALEKDVAKTLVQAGAPYQLVSGYHPGTGKWFGHGATNGEHFTIGIVDRTAEPLETLYPWVSAAEISEWKASEGEPKATHAGARRRAAVYRFLSTHGV